MKIFRIFLLPLAYLYGFGVWVRNKLYDWGIYSSFEFDIPIIGVGNLSTGGTGKTPHVEYLARLIKKNCPTAILSRGYGRKTTGFELVDITDTAEKVGDEPLQYKLKLPDVLVAVGENRQLAIPNILQYKPSIRTILLDDAFQHRSVKPGLNILLTPYSDLFIKDRLLPAGNLREWKSAYKRADIIIITKCPKMLSPLERKGITEDIRLLEHQKIYFSYMEYLNIYSFYNKNEKKELNKEQDMILLCGIARMGKLAYHLKQKVKSVKVLRYRDHYYYTERDLENLEKLHKNILSKNKIIITTEKDAARLRSHQDWLEEHKLPIYILPIQVQFHHEDKTAFDKQIFDFIAQKEQRAI